MGSLTEDNGAPNSDAQPNKRRRKKSIVWDHFTIETVDADSTRASCNQCKKSFAYISGSKLAGTSHLRRHITLGICPVNKQNQDKNQLVPITNAKTNGSSEATVRPRKRFRATPGYATMSFDQEHCSHDIAKMIIQHDYSLLMVEDPGFIKFARALQPEYNSVNSNTIQDHIVRIWSREKQNILSLLTGCLGRISLSLDLWSSDQSLGYVILTGQFADCDLKLHRRILNVIMLPYPDSEVAFNHAVAACLTDWSLDTKLFTLTLGESFSTENVRENLRGLLSVNNNRIFNGKLIIGSCYAQALAGVAQEALALMGETVKKVRQSVKYVVTSRIHQEKFNDIKQKLQVPTSRSLAIDDLTNWNTTYEMLISAFELREVFSCLEVSDPEYKVTPSISEWYQVATLCRYLKLLYNAASMLTAAPYPTANMFFQEASKIQLELRNAAWSPDAFLSNLTKPLWEIFDRYWIDCNVILAAAAVMDPRYKMKFVEFSFPKVHDEEDAKTLIKVVDEGLHDLFLEYVVQMLPAPIFMEESSESIPQSEISFEDGLLSTIDDFSDFDIYVSGIETDLQTKSHLELDTYLAEPTLPRVQDFDALGWWRVNRSKYPTLSKMAVDILSIPFSTVAPDRVFDTSDRKMDSYRSNLRPDTLEALICAKDWMQYGSLEFTPELSSAIVNVKVEF